ncbi:LytR cell envelope-related transcriptional attenuator [Halopolyspora algeriensis]|uniref:LytR cell envelope-related transcriptional attenuator n=1 Tax=Halopolyspora algeriensis TaxID=1500506 RepID=A0A368VQ63_9ACTN|nr:envelope integrity protein Cei [Halopolyspora algeriensis]RCW43989.1 LytR cell envelope-related transcriptional attenuator [Halopolyspora algeriensis]TQM53508.1 LytR cell envelope-related transcriptional attenuator [Halopolyspora algeriensis]
MSAASAKQGQQAPRYKRRRPLPALVLLAVLIGLSTLLWSRVFGTTETIEMATRCNRPGPSSTAPSPTASATPATSELGRMLPRDALDDRAPIPPQQVQVRVLNGNGEVNQASLISQELSNLGFSKGGDPANDPIYSNLNLNCHAQIRFGETGAGAARTLSLIVPCAQLVRDQRSDAKVDLALGKEFDGIRTTQEAMQVLQQLKNWGRQHDAQNDSAQKPRTPAIDDALLSKARDVHC